jgi:hypothetical protein
MGLAGNPLATRVFAAYCRGILPNRHSPGKTLLASKSLQTYCLQQQQKHLAILPALSGPGEMVAPEYQMPGKCLAFCQAWASQEERGGRDSLDCATCAHTPKEWGLARHDAVPVPPFINGARFLTTYLDMYSLAQL